MKKLINSVLLAFTLTFALSFVAPQQVSASPTEKRSVVVSKNQRFIYVITKFYTCDRQYLGGHVDIYYSDGTKVGGYDFDENGKPI